MASNAKATRANVIPTMRYRDAAAAIAWLCDAFGFERHEDYGGRGYSCRDPEGHLWNFGTFDPWN